MRKLDPAAYRTMPWKNGGGTTTEVLVLPPGADLASFELRISMARVESDGPFSVFDGIDRTLLITAGAGMILRGRDGATWTLDRGSPPFAFAGEETIDATLVDGPVGDLNVMSRRARLRHRAERLGVAGDTRVECRGEQTAVIVLEGDLVARDDVAEVAAVAGDVFALSGGQGLTLTPRRPGAAEILRVDFFRAEPCPADRPR